MVTTEQIKELREKTGLSVMQCKNALEESAGDLDKATESLKAQGASIAQKKSDRNLGSGVISSYIHANKTIGAMVELNCETDFVAKNEEFVKLAYEIAMQIAATNPENVEALLEEDYIKDSSKKISDLIQDGIQKFGENSAISRFHRFVVLEE